MNDWFDLVGKGRPGHRNVLNLSGAEGRIFQESLSGFDWVRYIEPWFQQQRILSTCISVSKITMYFYVSSKLFSTQKVTCKAQVSLWPHWCSYRSAHRDHWLHCLRKMLLSYLFHHSLWWNHHSNPWKYLNGEKIHQRTSCGTWLWALFDGQNSTGWWLRCPH